MTKYTITRRDEETECCYCGYPLFIGDVAYMSRDERNVYCTKACGGTSDQYEALERKEAETYQRAWPAFGCDWR